MKQIILTVGIPGSGKSTWAKTFVSENKGWVRINRDDLRLMISCSLDSTSKKQYENLILSFRDSLILTAIQNDMNVVVDDLNLAIKHQVNIQKLTHGKAEVTTRVFPTPLEICIQRDKSRDNPVGAKAIKQLHEVFVKRFGDISSPFTPVQRAARDLSLNPSFNPDPDKGSAIICDLDGTLALMDHRDPYDASSCDKDILNQPVAHLLRSVDPSIEIVFLSGRMEKYREPTLRFLELHGFRYSGLYMRPDEDFRKDSTVKWELYQKEIQPHYNVVYILDDRDQVVDMWRKNNLTCFQVAPGKF